MASFFLIYWGRPNYFLNVYWLGQNVTRPAKSPKLKKQQKSAGGRASRVQDESAAAEAMEISGAGFEGVGLGAL